MRSDAIGTGDRGAAGVGDPGLRRGNGRYRRIFARIWVNPEFLALNEGERVVALYVLTGPQVNRLGLFRFSPGEAAEDLRLSPIVFRRRFDRVLTAFGWHFDQIARILWIPSWWKFNAPEGPNQLKGALNDLGEVPASSLRQLFFENVETLPVGLRETLCEAFERTLPERSLKRLTEPYPKPSPIQYQEQEQEQEQEGDSSALGTSIVSGRGESAPAFTPLEWLKFWNQTVDTSGLPRVREITKKRRVAIAARWSEKPDRAYWKQVIRRLAKSPFCCGTNDRGWKADFDFLLKPDTHVKVLEGKYDADVAGARSLRTGAPGRLPNCDHEPACVTDLEHGRRVRADMRRPGGGAAAR